MLDRPGFMEFTMRKRLLKSLHPEGIPWPATLLYNAISSRKIFRQHYKLVARDVLQQGHVQSVLDIGAGPAWLLIALREVLPDARLCGIDISGAMVATAERNLRQSGQIGNTELKVGNAESLPFHDKTFDCVVSTGSIHHWKNPIAGLNEIHRVLKDGNRALIYDLVRKLPKDVSRQVKEEFGSFRLALLWLHSFEEPFLDTDEMLSIAEESSFQGADIWFRGALCCIGLKKDKS
jgi:ubiquinone/menaquinone biosynthesis C-methylase UbiE